MSLHYLPAVLLTAFCLAACTRATPSTTPTPLKASATVQPPLVVSVTEYPSLDWAINPQGFEEPGCKGELPETCRELIALGCAEIRSPRFYQGGAQPPYPVMECISNAEGPPDPKYFKQPPGLDTRYRTYVIYQDGVYRLIIKKSEFKEIFAPVESAEEALGYAMAMTALQARFDIDPGDPVEFLVPVIPETHVETTPDGFLVYLFDSDREMGCDTHSFYGVKVLVKPDGEVAEVVRQEIYRGYACFDFGPLTLDED